MSCRSNSDDYLMVGDLGDYPIVYGYLYETIHVGHTDYDQPANLFLLEHLGTRSCCWWHGRNEPTHYHGYWCWCGSIINGSLYMSFNSRGPMDEDNKPRRMCTALVHRVEMGPDPSHGDKFLGHDYCGRQVHLEHYGSWKLQTIQGRQVWVAF